MLRTICAAVLAASVGIGAYGSVYAGNQGLAQEDLEALLSGGRTVQLGGPGMGYAGTLELRPDGTGRGQAKTDGGDTITIRGTWEVREGKFCRTWAGIDGGATICETWVPVKANAVDVFSGGQKIGRNSW